MPNRRFQPPDLIREQRTTGLMGHGRVEDGGGAHPIIITHTTPRTRPEPADTVRNSSYVCGLPLTCSGTDQARRPLIEATTRCLIHLRHRESERRLHHNMNEN